MVRDSVIVSAISIALASAVCALCTILHQFPQAGAHSLLSKQKTMVSIIEALVPEF